MQVGSLAIQPKELQFAKKTQYFSIQRGSVWKKEEAVYCILLLIVHSFWLQAGAAFSNY